MNSQVKWYDDNKMEKIIVREQCKRTTFNKTQKCANYAGKKYTMATLHGMQRHGGNDNAT